MRTLEKKLETGFSKKGLIALLILLVVLAVYPTFSSYTMLNLVTRILILSVYAMSFDILRGYMDFLNLGHAVFFGGGAYISGILYKQLAPTLPVFLLIIVVVLVYSSVCAYIMGKISFRKGGGVLTATMITLALGEIVRHTAEKWRDVTNGTDGLVFSVPDVFSNRVFYYYFALVFLIFMTIVLKKFIMSPTGRVLLAIRENEQRAEFLGYQVEKYKLIALQVAGLSAGLSGLVFGTFNRFANTELLGVAQTTTGLLYTLVGGTGTLYGGIVGSVVVNVFQNIIMNLRSVHPIFERWLIFSGALYILVILFMPEGILGKWYKYREHKEKKNRKENKVEELESSSNE